MGLRARLTLIVVVGLLLVAASAVYTGNIPFVGQAQAAGSSGLTMSPGGSCGTGGGSCSGEKAAGGCSAPKTAASLSAKNTGLSAREAKQAKIEACASGKAEAVTKKQPATVADIRKAAKAAARAAK